MKKYLLLILLSLTATAEAFSQVELNFEETAKEIKKRELVVVLEPETYPEVKIMNEQLKKAIKAYWDFSDNYIFVYKQNLGDLKDTEYGILSFTKYTVEVLRLLGGFPVNTEMGISAGLSESFNPKNPVKTLTLVHTYVQGNSKEDYDLIVKEKDLIFAVQSMNRRLWNAYEGHGLFYNEAKHSTVSLADKILLVDLELLSGKFSEEDLDELYPHQYKVLPSDQIAEKINEGTGEYAYFGIIRGAAGRSGETQNYLISVIDGESGKSIGFSRKPMINDYEIDKKHIKSILKFDKKHH